MIPIAIQDWFDINDSKHLGALSYFLTKHRWPSNFLPKYVKVSKGSVNVIHQMILGAWSANLSLATLDVPPSGALNLGRMV